ncbi:hypothetical protein HP550_20435 [Cellulomonas humilata]|uniref:KAP NTPase domain-containing protein n=1 Tax=Cellulomonas humilata TaxID=144055 RepID=A0A7Y6A4H1_9CELL|nr:P-loop NTPase fold protein [Cellulomonas humilata]NUU19618.1 hypothetical protein [Cellulomonas humilata]
MSSLQATAVESLDEVPTTKVKWSASTTAAVRSVGGGPVAVTELVDALLASHRDDYLVGWPWRRPSWPSPMRQEAPDRWVPVHIRRQTADRWQRELVRLFRDDTTIFGRLAIFGWCLLDDDVASEAQSSGLLGGIASEVTPNISDFLSPVGLQVLRRRARLVAMSLGAIPPVVDLPGRYVEGMTSNVLAVDVAPDGRLVGRWAGVFSRVLHIGEGRSLSPALPSGEGFGVVALGWTSRGLGVVQAFGDDSGVLFFDRAGGPYSVLEAWPGGRAAAIAGDVIVVAPASDSALWGRVDSDVPKALPDGYDSPEDLVAVHGERVAFLRDEWIVTGGHDRPWERPRGGPTGSPSTCIAATADHVYVGRGNGSVAVIPWLADKGDDPSATYVGAFAGESIEFIAAAEQLVVAASTRQVALIRGTSVVARWAMAEGEEITGVTLGPDERTLAVGGRGFVRLWRIDSPAQLRLTSYTSDAPDGEDLLDIRPTVEALAAVVAARAVEPPLSVGLFGAWGSGKSFFMGHLQRRIQELCDESRESGRPQAQLWAWRNVSQVRFNAWQYAGADVWAGMLEQLIRELAAPRTGGGRPLQIPTDGLTKYEEERIRRLVGAVEQAQEDVRRAEEAVADARKVADTAQVTMVEKGEHVALGFATALGASNDRDLTALGGSIEKAAVDLARTRRSARATRDLLGRDQERLGLIRFVLIGVVVAVVLTVTAWFFRAQLAGLVGVLSVGATAIATILRWLSQFASATQKRLEEAEARENAATEAAKQAIEAEQNLRRTEAVLAQKREAAKATSPDQVLADYLVSRDQADEYRERLGLIGIVRRDLDVISGAVKKHNDKITSDEVPGDDTVNRVVLYVDDLDRCRPEVVVKVLESVSMLLSFPLFVVVVAVDAHWIAKSLASVYPTMLSGDVTPDNYLEKIFQLPVWLDSPTPQAASRMARELLAEAAPASRRPLVDASSATPGSQQRPRSGGSPQTSAQAAPPDLPRDVALGTSPPQQIDLAVDERAEISRLAPLLARSPRALKRYLNTYRLLKALIEPEQLRSARLLLAIATGRPALGERLLAEIASSAPKRTLADIVGTWDPESRAWLEIPTSEWGWVDLTCGELAPVVNRVRQFVFRSGVDGGPRPGTTSPNPVAG